MHQVPVIVDNNLVAFMIDTMLSVLIAFGSIMAYSGHLLKRRRPFWMGLFIILVATILSALLWLAQS